MVALSSSQPDWLHSASVHGPEDNLSTPTPEWRRTVSFRLGMDHAIRIVAFSGDFPLRAIEAPLNRWMHEKVGKASLQAELCGRERLHRRFATRAAMHT